MLTILIAPLVPCTARMAVVAFLAPAFFGPRAILVSWSLVLFSMVALVLSGSLLNKLIFNGQRSAFIMEMPLYHLPNARTIGLLVWQRSLSFVKKAGTNILAMALVIWVLSVLPGGKFDTSYLVQFGKWIEPVGRWMGFDWRLTVALITSFPAKENAIATLGVLFGSSPSHGLVQSLTSSFSVASGLSFLVVTMLFIPCMATVAVIRQETDPGVGRFSTWPSSWPFPLPLAPVFIISPSPWDSPFPDNSFDAVTVGYGLRNLASWETGLGEMFRVAKPGGRLVVLDFGKPPNALWRAIYFTHLKMTVPLLGWLFCGNADAYAYILESLKHYPAQEGVAAKMRELNLSNVRIVNLLGGAMAINYGEKPK